MYPYFNPDNPITDFRYTKWLVLGRAPSSFLKKRGERESLYIVMKNYPVELTIAGHTFVIVVPKGMTTDLASVPKIFRGLIGRVGPHLEACIVHDWLYVAWQDQNRDPSKADHKFANQVLYAGLRAANVGWFIRTAIKIAMETPWISWNIFRKRDTNLFVKVPS